MAKSEPNGKSISIDVVFPALHGPYGEDGTIQGFLETASIAYVGSGVLGSAAAMDKSFSKTIFTAAGMNVADGIIVTSDDWKSKVAGIAYPVFVKPAQHVVGFTSVILEQANKEKAQHDKEGGLADVF